MKLLIVQSASGGKPPKTDVGESGWEITATHSLKDGLREMGIRGYDAVVVDTTTLLDPDQQEFRSVFRSAQSPTCFLLVASALDEEIPSEALFEGVDGWLPLPLRFSDIRSLLDRHLAMDGELLRNRAELRRVDEEIAILVAISNIVTSNLEFIPLLAAIAHQTSSALQADRTTIFMYDAEGGKLQAAFAEGLGAYSITIPATHGVAGYVATQRKMVNVSHAYEDSRFYSEIDRGTGYHTESILCGPMISPTGTLIGVVQCLNKKTGTFTETDERMLSVLGPLFAIAIENAILYENLQEEVKHNERMTAENIRSERLAMVGRMARSVTRDIAGPMAEIVDRATQLAREDIGVGERDAISRSIESIVDHLVELAQELLNFSREHMTLERQGVSLEAFAAKLQTVLRGHEIEIEMSDRVENPELLLDAERVIEALTCLTSVFERFDKSGLHLRIDTPGTDIYFSFYPLSATTLDVANRMLGDPFSGTMEEHTVGMKLAVAVRIVDLHGGRFVLETDRLSIICPSRGQEVEV